MRELVLSDTDVKDLKNCLIFFTKNNKNGQNDFDKKEYFDDFWWFTINTKFYYYSNYYNYIINVKEIRDNIIKSKTVCKNGLEMTERF